MNREEKVMMLKSNLSSIPKRIRAIFSLLRFKPFVLFTQSQEKVINTKAHIVTPDIGVPLVLSRMLYEESRQVASDIRNNVGREELQEALTKAATADGESPSELLRWVEEIYEGRI